MCRRFGYTPEQIIGKLREVEVLMMQGTREMDLAGLEAELPPSNWPSVWRPWPWGRYSPRGWVAAKNLECVDCRHNVSVCLLTKPISVHA
jgi:hypothetical protein